MFASNLKKIMNERGITQTKLSQMTGISKSGISQYLSGVHKPGMKTLSVIAEALEVPEEYLDNEKRIDCATNCARSVPINVAAKLMGKCEQFIRIGLQRGNLPFGYAVKIGNKYTYYISPKLFEEVTGINVNGGNK